MKRSCFTLCVLFFLAACSKESQQLSNVSSSDESELRVGRLFLVPLRGAAEVPGPGDPNGFGTAILRINQAQSTINFRIFVANITLPATGAHIHVGTATEAGPVVVALTAPDASGNSSGEVDVDPALIDAILQNPANYYVNVHTTPLYEAGAVRGQLAN